MDLNINDLKSVGISFRKAQYIKKMFMSTLVNQLLIFYLPQMKV